MRRPNAATYLLGNSAGALAIIAVGGFLIYRWWIGAVATDWAPVIGLFLIILAANANQRLTSYRNWKRAWDAMEGSAPPPAAQGRLRTAMGMVLLAGVGVLLLRLDLRQSAHQFAAASYVLSWVVLLGATLWRRWRQRSPRESASRFDQPVTVSLPVARGSPGLPQIYANLPAYCRSLWPATAHRRLPR